MASRRSAIRRRCRGPIDRRSWLRLGGLSLGALCGGLSPSDSLLEAAARRAVDSEGTPLPPLAKDFSVILFWANGGPSHIDLFDLKPDAPTEYRGPFRPIQTAVPGMMISEELPRLASLADKFSLVRSLHHERAEHSGGTNRFLTGYASIQANLARSEYPTMGAVVSKHLEDTVRDVPQFVGNTPFYGAGAAYLGGACEAFMPSPFSQSASGNNRYDPVPIYTTDSSSSDLTITPEGIINLERRKQILQRLNRLPGRLDREPSVAALDLYRRRALAMLSSSATRNAFDLEQEDPRTRARYGDTHWGKSLLTCRRLVEGGVRFVQCQATYRLLEETGRTSNWDDHSVNSDIFKAYREKLPSFDQSVSAIIEDIYARGLDRKVLFIFCGEFGRTPLIRNQDASGRPGRDHWPQAMSVLVAGGGLQMGQVIGATNSRAEEPVRRIMNSNNLLATIYHQFGIDQRRNFLDKSGRPIPILTEGEPIAELL